MTRLAADFSTIQISRVFTRRLPAIFIFVAVLIFPISIWAQDQTPKDTQQPQTAAAASTDDELTQLRKEVRQLRAEVGRLKAELAKLDRYRTIDYTRDLMLKEEQRLRGLQSELNDIGEKETELNKRLDEIEEQQRPDRIERSLAGVGSVKPEEDREAISRRLANEKRRIQTQLETLRASRTRIPPLIVNAEESIARLKQRLNELKTLH